MELIRLFRLFHIQFEIVQICFFLNWLKNIVVFKSESLPLDQVSALKTEFLENRAHLVYIMLQIVHKGIYYQILHKWQTGRRGCLRRHFFVFFATHLGVEPGLLWIGDDLEVFVDNLK